MDTLSAVVLTCRDKSTARIYQKELINRQRKGRLGKDVVCLTVEDPASGVGSGGATLNALLLVTEHLSAKAGFTVANADVLQGVNILIVHAGRSFLFDPCGCAFVAVPAVCTSHNATSLVCNLDLLLDTMFKMLVDNPPGVWVCSTDMFLCIDQPPKVSGGDVCALAVPASLHCATKHGVYKTNKQDWSLANVIYQGSEEELSDCVIPGTDTVPIVSGIMWLNIHFIERLLSVILMSPMDACTYMGLDSGAKPIQMVPQDHLLELKLHDLAAILDCTHNITQRENTVQYPDLRNVSMFFDLLLPLCSDVTESEFVSGSRSGPYGRPSVSGDGEGQRSLMLSARSLLWKTLHGCQAHVVYVAGSHSYMDGSDPVIHSRHLLSPLVAQSSNVTVNNRSHTFIHTGCECDNTSMFINTRLVSGVKVKTNCVLSHCYIDEPVTVGSNTIMNGVWTTGLNEFPGTVLPDYIALQTLHINLNNSIQGTQSKHIPVMTVFGVNDSMKGVGAELQTYCNIPWKSFLQNTGITEYDLWSHVSLEARNLENARLFPVLLLGGCVGWQEILWLCGANNSNTLNKWKQSWRLSLRELMTHVDMAAEFDWRKTQFYRIAEQIIRDTLLNNGNRDLTGLYASAVVDGCSQQILNTLDNVAMETDDPGIAARTLANIADMLGAMAEGRGGLRSGPASNRQWQPAFHKLEVGCLREGISLLGCVRGQWCERADLLVRAARHYEGAAQILIRHAVMTARQFIQTSPSSNELPLNAWVTVECPARVDIAGGWSDTPPITYEHGGAVINAAITLDGQKPIGARVRKIAKHKILIHTGQGEGAGMLVIDRLEQLSDYNQPSAPGALLKAALICANIIQYPSQKSLTSQLEIHGGGFEIQTWSNLPQGSGLGTSSILAGGLMAALWTCSRQSFDIVSLNHAVLHLEQMLTTGGGWQDQVGGLTWGVKVGHSPVGLPLRVDMTRPDISEQTVKNFSDRLVLVYTGKTRLARNLLQNVVRNWYARDEAIVQTEDGLVSNAWACADCFVKGSLSGIGECMDTYWQQKKRMAPGCEPESVTRIMSALRPYVHGMTLAGAGGGGFLYVLAREPGAQGTVKQVLSQLKDIGNVVVHNAEVDNDGMTVRIEGQQEPVHIPYQSDSLHQ